MSNITNKGASAISLRAGGVFQTSTDVNLATLVGTRYDLSDGREVIFVSNSSAGVATSGHLMQDAALIANHQNATVGTFTAYSSTTNKQASIILTLGATAMTADQYQGGFAIVNSGTGIGQTLRIAGNNAALASSTTATIYLEDSPNVAIVAADSKVSLVPAHGKNVIDSPTTRTNVPCGVSIYNIPASSYGFLVSKGITSALSDASIAGVGYAISPSVTTAGAVTVSTATTGTLTNGVIGYTAIAGVSAEARPVFINL
jgi:hypothetical protein